MTDDALDRAAQAMWDEAYRRDTALRPWSSANPHAVEDARALAAAALGVLIADLRDAIAPPYLNGRRVEYVTAQRLEAILDRYTVKGKRRVADSDG